MLTGAELPGGCEAWAIMRRGPRAATHLSIGTRLPALEDEAADSHHNEKADDENDCHDPQNDFHGDSFRCSVQPTS